MNNLDFYIEKAMERQDLKSKRQLCIKLDVSHNAINDYKRGAFPSDTTMKRLAELAGENIEKALIELNVWRSPAVVQKAYASILQKIANTVLVICSLGAMTAASTPSYASDSCKMNSVSMNIMETHIIFKEGVYFYINTYNSNVKPSYAG